MPIISAHSSSLREAGLKDDAMTGQPVLYNRIGVDVITHAFAQLVASDTVDSATTQVLTAAGHAALSGHYVRFTSGALSGYEATIVAVTTNTITLGQVLPSIPANGVGFDILAYRKPLVDATGALLLSGAALSLDTELPAAAALADAAVDPTTPMIGGNILIYNGATWDRARGDIANGLDVDVTRSVLPTGAASLAEQQTQTTSLQLIDDAVAVTGAATPAKGLAISGTDGTDARIIKTDSSGELQVDVLTLPTVTLASQANPFSSAIPISDNAGSLTVDGTVAATQSGTWNVGTLTSITNVVHVDDNLGSLTVDNGGTFAVQDSQVITDNGGFTDGTSKLFMGGFIYDESAGPALTENDAAAARINLNRAQVGIIEDGSTRGRWATVTASNALKVDGSAVTQPVAGSTAHDAVGTSINPVMLGALARSTSQATVAADDLVRTIATLGGSPVVHLFGLLGDAQTNSLAYGDYHTGTNNILSAPGVGFRLVITDVTVSNGDAAATNQALLGDGSNAIDRFMLAGGACIAKSYPGGMVLPQNTPLQILTTAAGVTGVAVTAHGYKVPV